MPPVISIVPFILFQLLFLNGELAKKGVAVYTGQSARINNIPIVFEETFENNQPFRNASRLEIGDWQYALQYVSNPVFKGTKAARFEIRKEQPLVENGKRAEVAIIERIPKKEMWYSFAVYFPSFELSYDTDRETINQWCQNGSASTSLRVCKDRLILESGATPETKNQNDICLLEKDKWYEIVIHFIHSHTEDGLIEIWMDNKKMLQLRGGNMYDDVLPKWKVGIYKTTFKKNATLLSSRVIYFDNIKVGTNEASFSYMVPKKSYEAKYR